MAERARLEGVLREKDLTIETLQKQIVSLKGELA